jgi:hypothetical protein
MQHGAPPLTGFVVERFHDGKTSTARLGSAQMYFLHLAGSGMPVEALLPEALD